MEELIFHRNIACISIIIDKIRHFSYTVLATYYLLLVCPNQREKESSTAPLREPKIKPCFSLCMQEVWRPAPVSESTTALSTWTHIHHEPLRSRKTVIKVDSTPRQTLTAENDFYQGNKYVQESTQTYLCQTPFVSFQLGIEMSICTQQCTA